MSIIEFKRTLRQKAAGPGATWQKADFHIHAPGSTDYEYNAGDAVAQLGMAISDAGLAYAVILKHQEMPGRNELEALQAFCPRTTLIPGAEINVFVDTLFKQVSKDHFFHCIVAVDPGQSGDFGFVLERAKQQFTYRHGEYPAGFRSSITDLGTFFQDTGAIFIPAHLHQGKDPARSRSIDDLYDDDAFLGFVRDRTFTALEVSDLRTARFFDGTSVTATGTPIPHTVCVASSDAHNHTHIAARSRCSWVRTEERTFAELKAALAFAHRVRLDGPRPAHASIIGLHIVGAFIPECWLHLNEGLNALIGSKGSGKTALLECLRFVLATPVPSERQESVNRHLQHILGSGGYVECLVQLGDQSELLVTRRFDSASRLTLLIADGTTRSVPSTDGPGFPVSILGWHEIEAVADNPSARVGLLDRVDDPGIVRGYSESIHRNIEKARDFMPGLQRQIKRLDSALRVLWDLKRKRRMLSKLEEGALSALQSDYEEFLLLEQQLARLRQTAVATSESLPRRLAGDIAYEVLTPRPSGPASAGQADLARVADSVRDVDRLETESIDALQAGIAAVDTDTAAAAARCAELFADFRDNVYTPRVNALPTEEREVLARQIQVLEETKQLPIAEAEVADLLKEVRSLAIDVLAACDAIRTLRAAIANHRTTLVDRVNSELEGVRVTFQRSADHAARLRFQSRHGVEGGGLLEYVGMFAGSDTYDRLSTLFASLRDIDVSEEKFEIKAILYDVKAADLFYIVDDDDITIELKVGAAGFVPIQKLSAGQRCVAVFPLLLRDTRGPLIIDQPEDNLDNRYIADTIAPDLLRKKAVQQFLVTSHNANLVVLTDADLIVHVDSDGASSGVPVAGFLACGDSPVKQAVLDVLDGGEAALGARQRKYGLGAA